MKYSIVVLAKKLFFAAMWIVSWGCMALSFAPFRDWLGVSIGGNGVQTAWIGAVVAAATAIGSAVYGGISAHNNAKKQKKYLNNQRKENRAWYNRRYNEDATQRADAQRMLTRTNNAIKKRTQAAYGRKAVVGGTDASLASTQQANAEAVGNAMSDIVVNAESRKDAIEQQYRERDQSLQDSLYNVSAQARAARQQNVAQATSGVLNAVASGVESGGSGSSSKSDSIGVSKLSGSNGTTPVTPIERQAALDRTNAALAKMSGSVRRKYVTGSNPWLNVTK